MKKQVVFTETGEVLGDLVEPRRWTGEGYFIKVYREELRKAVRELGGRDFRVLLYLVGEMVGGNEVRVYATDVAKDLGLSKEGAYEALRSLCGKGYCARERAGIYTVSKAVAWRGRRVAGVEVPPVWEGNHHLSKNPGNS